MGVISLAMILSACGQKAEPTGAPLGPSNTPDSLATETTQPVIKTMVPTSPPVRELTICLDREPASLFLYAANSLSAQSVLAAVYDAPFDMVNYVPQAVILEKTPSLADGDILLQPVEVRAGELMVDITGKPSQLREGVSYRPAGCYETACGVVFNGSESVQMDQMSIRFTMLSGLQWSDGTPLEADDSLYSYEVAQALFPLANAELLAQTADYRALDEHSVEWVGLPGFMDGQVQNKFFSPLPRHAWGTVSAPELSNLEAASRKPMGWGPYVIDEWVAGEHIALSKNPRYFRAGEGLPAFDKLVYRFLSDGSETLGELLIGECDLINPTTGMEGRYPELQELAEAGEIMLIPQPASAWELIQLGINPLDEERPAFFTSKEVRQAVAMCLDKPALASANDSAIMQAADVYVPPGHPLYNQDVVRYGYDPQRAGELLTLAGWVDLDNDPATPRTAQGVAGIVDGTAFVVELLAAPDAKWQGIADEIKSWLGQCGIQVDVNTQPFEEYLAAGPEGSVFGRKFDMALLAWPARPESSCQLYQSEAIPGPYPDYEQGWGGANAAGYSNPLFDAACWDALYTINEMPGHVDAHFMTQAIFADDLPVIPLSWRFNVMVTRADFCGLQMELLTENPLANIEKFDYGDSCR